MDQFAGNAKVGDVVWLRMRESRQSRWGPWQKTWRVTATGPGNDQPQFSIQDAETGETRTLFQNPFGNGDLLQTLIQPPPSEYAKCAALTEALVNPSLLVVRDRNRGDGESYQLVCTRCGRALYHQIEHVQSASLSFDPRLAEADGAGHGSGFEEGRPSLESFTTTVVCGCAGISYHLHDRALRSQ